MRPFCALVLYPMNCSGGGSAVVRLRQALDGSAHPRMAGLSTDLGTASTLGDIPAAPPSRGCVRVVARVRTSAIPGSY